MRKCNDHLHVLTEKEIKEIQSLVNQKLGEYRKNDQIIKEDIFNILRINARVIYYPIEDDEICGFYSQIKEEKFVYINTFIPLEKQIFAAAHELYHMCRIDKKREELLKKEDLEFDRQDSKNDLKMEAKANRFAAEFLVQKSVLINELDLRNIKRGKIKISDIVVLMDVFIVPYKTMVRRLFEIDYMDETQCREFLKIPDRTEGKDVMLLQKRLGVCQRNNIRTNTIKIDNLIDLALGLYEKKYITYEKLEYLLSFSNYTPEDFEIQEQETLLPAEEEFLKILEEEENEIF